MEIFIEEAISQAKLGNKKGEVPIGCVIVQNNKIISKAHNETKKRKDPTKHAEIIAISKACKKKKSQYLNDCILYSTSEPCVMCIGAIAQAKIKKIVYVVENKKFGYSKFLEDKNVIMNHYLEIEIMKDNQEPLKILKSFFKNKR